MTDRELVVYVLGICLILVSNVLYYCNVKLVWSIIHADKYCNALHFSKAQKAEHFSYYCITVLLLLFLADVQWWLSISLFIRLFVL